MATGHRLFYHSDDAAGWAPVTHLAAMACRLLGAEPVDLANRRLEPLARLRAALGPSRRGQAARRGKGGDFAILRAPSELGALLADPRFAEPRAFRAVWIIDSFWTDHLPRPARRLLSHFDVVAYTRKGDAAFYEGLCGSRALFLGWGTDALDLGSGAAERPWDVLRVGRQPESWDDDARTAAACAARGLRFHGRPPFGDTPAAQHRDLMAEWYGRAKFVIAHSNLAAPAPYTHPTRDYVTARWTDALASGAAVAGVAPRGDLALIDWPGALVDFGSTDLEANLDLLAEAAAAWTPAVAAGNHRNALARLDWRWRLSDLARRLDLHAPALDDDLNRLRAAIDA